MSLVFMIASKQPRPRPVGRPTIKSSGSLSPGDKPQKYLIEKEQKHPASRSFWMKAGRMMRMLQWVIVATSATVSSFTISPSTEMSKSTIYCRVSTKKLRSLCSSASGDSSKHDDDNNHKDHGLLLNGLDQEMGKMVSKFSFTEVDFLAAAKKRAEARVESRNASAGDDDWQILADEKKTKYGEIDDWESSKKEAGNQDSQILMFTDPPATEEDGGEDAEPKLLLF
jgi:hypothetical protein